MFNEETNQAIVKALKKIYEMKGDMAFQNPRIISAYMSDLLPGADYERCRYLLKLAGDTKAYPVLLNQSIGNMNQRVDAATKLLQREAFIDEKAARCVIEWAACALDPSYSLRAVEMKNAHKEKFERNDYASEENIGRTVSDHPQDNCENYSRGLQFKQLKDGNFAVSGIGTCQDQVIRVPPTTPQGGRVTEIAADAFLKNNNLRSVIIPHSITTIRNSAFSFCDGLTTLTIPGSVTTLESGFISYCSGFKSLVVEADNPVYYSEDNCIIERKTCKLVGSLPSSRIPNHVRILGSFSVHSCGKYNYNIPWGVVKIEPYVFCGDCVHLLSIFIPSTVTDIQPGAFGNCQSRSSITIERNNPVYYSESDCIIEKVTGILVCGGNHSTIPSGVSAIADYAFQNCYLLRDVIIPYGVVSIGLAAFRECFRMKKVYIPRSVTSISGWYNTDGFSNGAFSRCESLHIFCEHSQKPTGWEPYWNPDDCPVTWGADSARSLCYADHSVEFSSGKRNKGLFGMFGKKK